MRCPHLTHWRLMLVSTLLSACVGTSHGDLVFRNDSEWTVRVHVLYWNGDERTMPPLRPCESLTVDSIGRARAEVSAVQVEGGERFLMVYLDDKALASYRDALKDDPAQVLAIAKTGARLVSAAQHCEAAPAKPAS